MGRFVTLLFVTLLFSNIETIRIALIVKSGRFFFLPTSVIEAALSHSDTPHLLELLWTSDQPDLTTRSTQK